jgi:hypothetical protein
VYAVLEKPLLYVLHRLGLPFRVVGTEAWYFNTLNYPVCADFIRYAQNMGLMVPAEAAPLSSHVSPPLLPFTAAVSRTAETGGEVIIPAA